MYDSASVEGACSEDFGAPVSGRVGVANCLLARECFGVYSEILEGAASGAD